MSRTEQRLRILGTVARVGVAAVHLSRRSRRQKLGDNGSSGDSMSRAAWAWPPSRNLSRMVGLRLERIRRWSTPIPVLEEVEPVREPRMAMRLPIGPGKGRQPVAEIGEIYANDGRRGNRWGTSLHESATASCSGPSSADPRHVAEGDAYRPDSGWIGRSSCGARRPPCGGRRLQGRMTRIWHPAQPEDARAPFWPGWRDPELTVNTSTGGTSASAHPWPVPVRAGLL